MPGNYGLFSQTASQNSFKFFLRDFVTAMNKFTLMEDAVWKSGYIYFPIKFENKIIKS